jgi:hypothetical protein
LQKNIKAAINASFHIIRRNKVDITWIQTLTTIGSIMTMTVGSIWAFYLITSRRIDALDSKLTQIDLYHREDMIHINERFIKLEEKWDNRFNKMEEKWERLFERLYPMETK